MKKYLGCLILSLTLFFGVQPVFAQRNLEYQVLQKEIESLKQGQAELRVFSCSTFTRQGMVLRNAESGAIPRSHWLFLFFRSEQFVEQGLKSGIWRCAHIFLYRFYGAVRLHKAQEK